MTVLERITSAKVHVTIVHDPPNPNTIITSFRGGTHLSRVTSWEAPNIATPLREARRGKGMDCNELKSNQTLLRTLEYTVTVK